MNINLGSIQLDLMVILLLLGGATCLGLLVYIQNKKDSLDLRYLIFDDKRKPSINKIGQLMSLLISSWAFVYLVLHDKITETYYTMYMGIYAATTVANKLADRLKNSKEPQ